MKKGIGTTVWAFRGYNVTNLGRTPELLAHPVYGPVVEGYLRELSELCGAATGRKVDLVCRVRERQPSSLDTYAEDLAMIVAVELAQLKLLERVFDIPFNAGQLAFGFSLGELTALIAGGVFGTESLITPILALARDAAELAEDIQMGILFSRGPALSFGAVERRCLEITMEGKGTIGISTYLSPNSVLLIGQGDTINRFKESMHDGLPDPAHLRVNPHRWPPIHTWIVKQRNIADRAAVMLECNPGGLTKPSVPVLSCITGDYSYGDHNSREILCRWVDHPQQLWSVVKKTLSAGVETIVHVGPEPNIVPATFTRLSNNVTLQLSGRSWASLGRRAISRIAKRSWLTNLLSDDATLLRAPFISQFVLEDWLLRQDVS